MRHAHLIALLFFLSVLTSFLCAANVDISLKATWKQTSLIAEASEFLASENTDYFWKFAHEISSASEMTAKQEYDAILEAIPKIMPNASSETYKLLQYALSAHYYAPQLEVFNQLARDALLHFDKQSNNVAMFAVVGTSQPGKSFFLSSVEEILKATKGEVNADNAITDSSAATTLFPFDHVLESCNAANSNSEIASIVVYASLLSKDFKQVHEALQRECQNKFVYAFRHFDLASLSTEKKDSLTNVNHQQLQTLQGYGVELQIKNMEYKQMDDSILKHQQSAEAKKANEKVEMDSVLFSSLEREYPELAHALNQYKDQILESSDDARLPFVTGDALKEKGIGQLGIKAAQLILGSDPKTSLKVLQQVSQNFPTVAATLLKVPHSSELEAEIANNQNYVESGRNILLVSGAMIDLEKMSIFNLLELIRSEITLRKTLSSEFHLPETAIQKLLSTNTAAGAESADRFDILSHFGDQDIFYLNDIETESRYNQFPRNLVDMLQPTYFGQMRFVKRNLFTCVFIVDPSTGAGLDAVFATMQVYSRGWPLKFGFIFASSDASEAEQYNNYKKSTKQQQFVNVGVTGSSEQVNIQKEQTPNLKLSSLSSKLMKVLYHIKETQGTAKALQFLMQLRESDELSEKSIQSLVSSNLAKTYQQIISDSAYNKLVSTVIGKLVDALGGSPGNVVPALFLNGLLFKNYQASPDQMIMSAVQSDYASTLQLIRTKAIKDSDKHLCSAILKAHGAYKIYNAEVFASKQEQRFANLNLLAPGMPSTFFHKQGTETKQKPLTHLLVVNLDSASGIQLLIETLKHIEQSDKDMSRAAVIHSLPSQAPADLNTALSAATYKPEVLPTLIKYLESLVEYSSANSVSIFESVAAVENPLKSAKTGDTLHLATDQHVVINQLRRGAAELIGHNSIVTNGRLIQLKDSDSFLAAHVEMLENFEYKQRVKAIEAILEDVSFSSVDPDVVTSDWRSTILYGLCTIYATRVATSNFQRSELPMNLLRYEHASIKVNQAQQTSIVLPITAVLNPLSVDAQKISSLLTTISNHFGFPVTVILNPPFETSEVPLKSWYRFVFDVEMKFDADGKLIEPHAVFKNIPSKNILTAGMDVPETWLIESSYALDDLDNINLQNYDTKQGATLVARYQLENIIITGSCVDVTSSPFPPRGLQLELTEEGDPMNIQDTLVMANYGYYQLKANPNIWTLSLSDAHSTIYDIFKVVSEKSNKITNEGSKIFLTSFDGPFLTIQVKKKPGKEKVDLLEGEKQQEAGLWGKVKNLFGSPEKADDQENDEAKTINIFSVASGHMYERLLKIMILSVVKNTKRSPVKFWFIKNFLSPQFKRALPLMAKHYNFKYQFVTYKWPTWLNKQTQKQRIIWAYKVLFLDVLFPLKVQKILFVDADQVTRADLTELFHETDLGGKPLGYTPFCSSRTEMDGYRFWKTGYWAQHLRGLPYHISALYVVDIKTLRKMYAGDQFRMIYDNLSKDPNSLSNLDQDLPNYAQHAVPIHSLDQHWLWCETWCSEEDKKKAKTIDLCNNPMTKEHKLESARRIIPEWTQYDDEIKKFEEGLHDKGLL